MDIIEAVQTRKSVRAYKPDPVPADLLREILEISVRAPSAMNTQPWEFTVVTGEPLEQMRRDNVAELMKAGKDVLVFNYTGVYRDRQVDLAKRLFQLMEIKREDKEKRTEWLKRGFRYFDAPAALIISMDRSLEERTWAVFDLGVISQTICLVALKYGLATCIEDQGVIFPEVIRAHTGLPETKIPLISIAIGYPDWDFPANALQSPRESAESLTTWCGFEE